MHRPLVLGLVLAASLIANAVATLALLGYTPSSGAEAATSAVGAKAFASVRSDGVLFTTRARNVNSVTRPSAGLYCLKLAVTVKNVVASLNTVATAWVISGGLIGTDGSPAGCPAGADVFVSIFNPAAGNGTDAPFYVLMH